MDFEVTKVAPKKGISVPDPLRVLGGATARALETGLGSAGDLLKAGGDLVVGAFNKIPGGGPGIPEFHSLLPTSQQLKKGTEALTGEALKPKSDSEKFLQDVVSDITSFAVPIPGLGKGQGIKKAVKLAIGSNVAAKGAEMLGGGELAQTGAKFSVVLGSSLRGLRPQLESMMHDAYSTVRTIGKEIPVEAKHINQLAKSVQKEIKSIVVGKKSGAGKSLRKSATVTHKDKLKKLLTGEPSQTKPKVKGYGLETPSKEILKKPVSQIIEGTKLGTTDAAHLAEMKQNLNEIYANRATPKGARGKLGKLIRTIDDELKEAGKHNKEFGEAYYTSDNLYKGLNVKDTVDKNMKEFFTSNYWAKKIPLKSKIQDLSEFAYLAIKSPVVARHYRDVSLAAIKNNKPLIAKQMARLLKAADKAGSEFGEFEVTKSV
jgi:hypothetical protein